MIFMNRRTWFDALKRYLLDNKVKVLALLTFFLVGAITIYVSYAFYEVRETEIIVEGSVGEISLLDVNIMIEARDDTGVGTGKYVRNDYIPRGGYTYNDTESYCVNGSTIVYDSDTYSASIGAVDYDMCYLYFDADASLDILVDVYIEDLTVDGSGLGTYSLLSSEEIPSAGYMLNESLSKCDNGSSISYNMTNNILSIGASSKDTCDVYLDALDVDVSVTMYLEKTAGSGDYYQAAEIPYNVYYNMNESLSSCTNSGVMSFKNQQIVINTTTKTVCNAYLDVGSGPIMEEVYAQLSENTVLGTFKSYSGANVVQTYYYSLDGGETFNETQSSSTFEGTNVSGTAMVYGVDADGNESNILKVSVDNGYAYNGIFPYASSVRTKTIQKSGYYLIQTWGGEGGTHNSAYAHGGYGGYSIGKVYLNEGDTVYVYTGGAGSAYDTTTYDSQGGGGTNGGGAAGYRGGGGGGATDVRINNDSLYARVLVAGGGGGAYAYSAEYSANGGSAGGLYGMNGDYYEITHIEYAGVAGGQISGGIGGIGTDTLYNGADGTFGFGGSTGYKYNDEAYYSSGGGGGGWYGGGAGANYNGASYEYNTGGGGGSGYVYTAATLNYYPEGCLLDSTYYMLDATLYGGNRNFVSPFGYAEKGHRGNGYVKITYLGTTL